MDERIRVLIAEPRVDGYDRGATLVVRALTPEMIVNTAVQEDVQVIGLSILSGAHTTAVPRLMELLRERGLNDVIALVGGIIPDEDVGESTPPGVAGAFRPGASLEEIVRFIRSSVKQPA